MSDIDYSTLDPGIREVVRLLREAGHETTDSGDGVSKGADGLPRAHVVIRVDRPDLLVHASFLILGTLEAAGVRFGLTPEEADRLQNGDETVPLRQVEATFSPTGLVSIVTVWGVTDADLRGVP